MKRSLETGMNNPAKNRPTVVVLVGLPASGKSTARAAAAANGITADSYHYSSDDHIDAYAAELGSTYSEVFKDYVRAATKLADDGLTQAIQSGRNVVWDQTNMTRKKRRQILERFPRDYRYDCICILPPFTDQQEEELQRRLASRAGKDIPDFVMRSMRDSFVLPTQSEGFNRVMYFDIYGNMIDRNRAADLFGNM
jgi:predicted kinase